MNYLNVTNELKNYDSVQVTIFIAYLKELENAKDRDRKPLNKWFPFVKEKQVIDLFKEVAIDNLFIDGKTITLSYKGKLMVDYNYQAYKNKLLNVYPESLFDVQNVHEGDAFSFKKESGKVIYKHELKDPFKTNKVIIGAYCVIKNKRGEFIEVLNRDDISKMRNVAKTQKIWNAWEGEMILKSVIKRACKRHFKDITSNIETLDNENYNLETVNVAHSITDEINNCDTIDELSMLYGVRIEEVEDKQAFMQLCTDKKMEIYTQLKAKSNDNS